ncbi:MAG TPA: immunoglobulin domain-containing protein [Gemmataceae bacterium]|nr:immunoglobulin domain-containing protein [Gemmataceae bacterium]
MFPSWLSHVFDKTTKPSRVQRRAARPATRPMFRPRLEALEDRLLLSATLPVSVAISGTETGNTSSVNASSLGDNGQSVSANGQYEVFISSATNLVNGVTIQGGSHVYLRNLSTGTTTLVDVASNGTQSGDEGASDASITSDGRYVAFLSSANDLTGNGSGNNELYVRDMVTGQTYLVSLGTDGKPANSGPSGGSIVPSIAEDDNGHLLIAYESTGTNLTPGDSIKNTDQIFLASLNLDSSGAIQYSSLKTTLVSADNSGTGQGGSGASYNPVLSQDSSTLTFDSYAANLNIPGGYNDNDPDNLNLYLYSLANQTLQPLSVEPTTTTAATGNQSSDLPAPDTEFDYGYQESVSANGQYAVFTSSSDNLVPSVPTDDLGNVYLRNLNTGATSLVSIGSDGTTAGDSGSNAAVITPDGRYVAFDGSSNTLTSNSSNGRNQVYVRDMETGQTYLVTLGIDGNPTPGTQGQLSIAETSNGQLAIAYSSTATNLTPNDTNSSNSQVFVTTFKLDANGDIEYNTLSTTLVSADSSGNGGNGDSGDAILSKDGSTLAFVSEAANLPGETPDNANAQVFTYNLATGQLTQVSPAAPSGDTTDSSWLSSISDNGQYLTYDYQNNTTGTGEVLAWNAATGTNTTIYATKGAVYPVLGATLISGDGSTIAFRAGNAGGDAVIYSASNWQSGSPTITQISPAPGSSNNVYSSQETSISDNGQVIAYQLTPYSNSNSQVYVYDNGTTTEASQASSGGDSNGVSSAPEISADGSTVVFDSNAGNLVSGITDFVANLGFSTHDNVFAYNVAGNTVSLVSAKAPGVFTAGITFAGNTNNAASLSDNGQFLTFWSSANDLLSSLPDTSNVFAENVQTGVLTLIAQGSQSVISGNGSTVAFQSNQLLTSNDVKGGDQIFTAAGWQSGIPAFTLVSVDSAGTDAGNQTSENPSISDNGQVVAFDSTATNLTGNDADANGYTQIFVSNLGTNTTTLASPNSAGTDGGDNNSDSAVVSADGSTVIFDSNATNLISGVSVATDSSGDPIVPNVYAYLSNTSAPVITGQPSNQTVIEGNTATFTVAASGSPAPVVQWQVSTDGGKTFSDISGATSTTLTLSNVQASQNGYEYQAVFTNLYGTAATSAATLTVNAATSKPQVTINPSNQTVTAGQTATFTASANGNPTPTVQWQVSTDGGKTFTNISGATSTTLTLNNVLSSWNDREYQAVFTNSLGSAATAAASLTVQTAPAITSGNSAVFTAGQGGSFTVTATGSPTPTLTESGALPRGVAFTNNGNGTATLGGTPAAGSQGTYHFSITAHNGVSSDFTQSFTLTVNPVPVPPPPPPPPSPPPPPVLNVPPLLAFFDSLLGGVETVNANGTETIADNFFGIPLLVSTFDSHGNLVSVDLFGAINITFLFV